MNPSTTSLSQPDRKVWQVLGIIDAYGAVEYRKLYLGDETNHEQIWPVAQKRWRFMVSDWKLEDSPLTTVPLDRDDQDAVLNKMRKVLPLPDWLRRNEAWDAAGRPRGAAYERFNRRYERAEAKHEKNRLR